MAAAQHKLSRRTLLGAAFALPVAAAHPARSEPSRGPAPSVAEALNREWTRALAALRRAEATVTALEGHPDEAAFGRAHERFNALFRQLLATPAPDIAALADKLEIAAAAELAELTFAPPALAQLAADARRLASRSS